MIGDFAVVLRQVTLIILCLINIFPFLCKEQGIGALFWDKCFCLQNVVLVNYVINEKSDDRTCKFDL